MQEAADALIDNLLASEAFVRYHQASINYNMDARAQVLLHELSQMQAALRKKQAESRLSKDEIDALRALQGQAQDKEVIKGYAQAQQEAVDFLREINGEISQMLGVDFASLAKHTGCC
jgi:cell fate (sporulation/competence/biofilm development) regulator YlbF (YheA/YmcA/DUF963 family)